MEKVRMGRCVCVGGGGGGGGGGLISVCISACQMEEADADSQ